MQLVVLAGGLGTRLRGAISDGTPKPMAPIAGKPFLEHLLDRAVEQGVDQVHLLTGYRAEVVSDHFGSCYRGVPVTYSVETVPLGTGGALKAALDVLQHEFILANGDTFADVDYRSLLGLLGPCPIGMSLARVDDVSRFGSVTIDDDVVVGFGEKTVGGAGMVNAGVYACRQDLLALFPGRPSFSFEADFLQPALPTLKPRFQRINTGMIDIGTPESYSFANDRFGG